MNRRQFGLLVVGSGFFAGCLGNGGDESSRSDSTSSDDWIREAQTEPEYDRTVMVRNERSEPVEIDVAVIHEGDEGPVYSDTHTVAGESESDVYDFRDAPTEGVERYRIEGRLENGEETSFPYSTNECMASPGLIVEEDGTLESIWAEC